MKKTYNVISKNVIKFSVMFCFTLFFLGMSTDATAQFASSRASAGATADADLSAVVKADITKDLEEVVSILKFEMEETKKDLEEVSTPEGEASLSARYVFIQTAYGDLSKSDANSTVNDALSRAYLVTADQISGYNSSVQNLVKVDDIANDIIGRLK